jgi:hypothetical protein
MDIKQHLIPNRRNRIAELRESLSDISRKELDTELVRMALSGEIHLYGHDDPTETTEADREAALTFGGEPCYLIYI